MKFKIVDKSGECESHLILSDIDLNVNNKMIQSECRDGFIRIKNLSEEFEMKNIFISCSHPLILNFENLKLFSSIP